MKNPESITVRTDGIELINLSDQGQLVDAYQNQNPYLITVAGSSTNIEFNLTNISIWTFVKSNFYHEYNFFIEQYNNDINRIDDLHLEKLSLSIFTALPNCCCCCCWLFLSVIIFTSVPTFIYNLIRFIIVIKCTVKVKDNRNKVKNPFQKMIYIKGLKAENDYYEVKTIQYTNDLVSIGVSQENFRGIYTQIQQRFAVLGSFEVMFYRDKFANYYLHAPRYLCLDIFISSIYLLLSFISATASLFIIYNMVFG